MSFDVLGLFVFDLCVSRASNYCVVELLHKSCTTCASVWQPGVAD